VCVSWLTDPDEDWQRPDDPYAGDQDEQDDPPRSRLKLVALLLGGWLAVSLLVLLGLLAFSGHGRSNAPPTTPPAAAGSPTGDASSSARAGAPAGWVRRAADEQRNCAAHSYGQVQIFFARTPCTSVRRALLTTERGGRTVLVATSEVSFGTAGDAARYLDLVTADGTGNIDDLLREGTRYAGSPSKLPTTAFASRLDRTRVLVAEAGFTDGTSAAEDATLQAIAKQGVGTG